jgi:hypothetical protein
MGRVKTKLLEVHKLISSLFLPEKKIPHIMIMKLNTVQVKVNQRLTVTK